MEINQINDYIIDQLKSMNEDLKEHNDKPMAIGYRRKCNKEEKLRAVHDEAKRHGCVVAVKEGETWIIPGKEEGFTVIGK